MKQENMNNTDDSVDELGNGNPCPKDVRGVLCHIGPSAVAQLLEAAETYGVTNTPSISLEVAVEEPGAVEEHRKEEDTDFGDPLKTAKELADATPDPEDEKNAVVDSRPRVELAGKGRALSAMAKDVGNILKDKEEVFRMGHEVCLVNLNGDGLQVMRPHGAQTDFEAHISFGRYELKDDDYCWVTQSMHVDTARCLLEARPLLTQLREIRGILPTRLPVIRESGKIELLPKGYDHLSKLYTKGNGCDYPLDMPVGEAIAFLHNLYAEFPFTSARSLSVAFAGAMTMYAANLLPYKSLIPCFIYQANAEGSGKTTLAYIAGVPYGLVSAQSAPTTETEWSKLLVSLVRSGKKHILIDNVKGTLNSGALEGYITSTSYSGRVLGASTIVSGDADAVIFITANDLEITPDLRRRSLISEVFLTDMRSEDRKFTRRLDPPAILEQQSTILAAMYALVRNWDEMGRPKCSKVNASFPAWCDIIGGIVEAAGFACPTEAAVLKTGGDIDTKDVESLATKMKIGQEYRFTEIANTCLLNGLFERIIGDTPLTAELNDKARSALPKLLKKYDQRQVAEGKVLIVTGQGHKRRYSVQAPA